MSENKENNKQINGEDFKKKLSNKAWLIYRDGHNLNWSEKR